MLIKATHRDKPYQQAVLRSVGDYRIWARDRAVRLYSFEIKRANRWHSIGMPACLFDAERYVRELFGGIEVPHLRYDWERRAWYVC